MTNNFHLIQEAPTSITIIVAIYSSERSTTSSLPVHCRSNSTKRSPPGKQASFHLLLGRTYNVLTVRIYRAFFTNHSLDVDLYPFDSVCVCVQKSIMGLVLCEFERKCRWWRVLGVNWVEMLSAGWLMWCGLLGLYVNACWRVRPLKKKLISNESQFATPGECLLQNRQKTF